MSLLFYFWGEEELVLIMIFSCIMNYSFGIGIHKATEKNKKLVVGLGVALNLALLAYFKYADFFISSVNALLPEQLQFSLLHIVLPIGISFFTFQSISYLVDVYRGDAKVQKNPFDLSLYIALFPQLIAGPIVRYHDLAESLSQREHSIELFVSGAKRFVFGLAKKLLVANVMAQVVEEVVHRNPGDLNAFTIWFALLCFGMQVYYDFSGYSDMAIGLGRMFGFKFLENFDLPFISKSLTEFWRRWHISLSTFIRDYVYIPLGGSRKSTFRVYLNLFIIFFLTGLWHGSSWNYVSWGIFHGIFMVNERWWLGKYLDRYKLLGHLYYMFVITISWVVFLVESPIVQKDFFWVMFTGGRNPDIGFWPNNEQMLVFIVAHFFAFNGFALFEKFNSKFIGFSTESIWSRHLINTGTLVILVYCILTLSSNSYNPFIYFRF